MYDNYDDFFEPSEYDMMVEELKTTLRKSIAKEWVDKMNKLEKENSELQEIKKNFEEIKRDYENKKLQAVKDARTMRLKELMQDVQKCYWKPETRPAYSPKCNKCNEDRKITFFSPSGKKLSEDCECKKHKYIYAPMCEVVYEIRLKNRNSNLVNVYFTSQKGDNDDDYFITTEYYGNKIIVEDYYDNFTSLSNEKLDNLYFVSEQKCQEFCDWYNKTIFKVDTDKYKIENK